MHGTKEDGDNKHDEYNNWKAADAYTQTNLGEDAAVTMSNHISSVTFWIKTLKMRSSYERRDALLTGPA